MTRQTIISFYDKTGFLLGQRTQFTDLAFGPEWTIPENTEFITVNTGDTCGHVDSTLGLSCEHGPNTKHTNHRGTSNDGITYTWTEPK